MNFVKVSSDDLYSTVQAVNQLLNLNKMNFKVEIEEAEHDGYERIFLKNLDISKEVI